MNRSTSARACFAAASDSEGAVLAVQKARPPASSCLVKRTRSPRDDHWGLEYSCSEAKVVRPLPSTLMSINRDAELLAPAGLLASSSEAPSGAQFRSDQVCPVGHAVERCQGPLQVPLQVPDPETGLAAGDHLPRREDAT